MRKVRNLCKNKNNNKKIKQLPKFFPPDVRKNPHVSRYQTVKIKYLYWWNNSRWHFICVVWMREYKWAYSTDQILKVYLCFILLMIKMKVFLTVKPVFFILYQINLIVGIKYLLAQCVTGKMCVWPVKLMPVTKEGCHAPVRASACYHLRELKCANTSVCTMLEP